MLVESAAGGKRGANVQLAEAAIEVRAPYADFTVRGRNAYLGSGGHRQPAVNRASIMTHPDHWVYAAAIAAQAMSTPAISQDSLRASEEQLVNYAFATQLGSGVYSISGRTLQIYRLPFDYTMTEPAENRPGIRLTLPLTIGLVDFEPQDVFDTGLPENLDTLGFVPGIELDFVLTPHWHLLLFAQAGRAWERAGGNDATVFSFGVHATATMDYEAFDLRFDVGGSYAAVDPDEALHSDDIVLIEAGIEGRRPLGLELTGHPLDWGAYLLADFFADQADEPLDKAGDAANPVQLEVGVTVGPHSRITVWRIPMPRLGVGYRFSDDLGVWRLVFGQPF